MMFAIFLDILRIATPVGSRWNYCGSVTESSHLSPQAMHEEKRAKMATARPHALAKVSCRMKGTISPHCEACSYKTSTSIRDAVIFSRYLLLPRPAPQLFTNHHCLTNRIHTPQYVTSTTSLARSRRDYRPVLVATSELLAIDVRTTLRQPSTVRQRQ